MISALNKQTDGTLELTITIPWKRVKAAYDKTLTKLTQTAQIKGFRKGKAPQKLVEKKVGQSTIYEELLHDLVPEVYLETVREQKIAPIITPKVSVVSLESGKDWQIKAVTCERTKVKLGDYKGEVKKALAAEKIWVPGKDKKESSQTKEQSHDQQLQKIFATLLKTSQIKLPQILIDQEVSRMLSRLVDQIGRLGLTVEEYLHSLGKTQEELRKEYEKQAQETLKLEFILEEIAAFEKIKIKKEEIDQMIAAVPDEKSRKKMATPLQRAYIEQLLQKRAVIDSLMKL